VVARHSDVFDEAVAAGAFARRWIGFLPEPRNISRRPTAPRPRQR